MEDGLSTTPGSAVVLFQGGPAPLVGQLGQQEGSNPAAPEVCDPLAPEGCNLPAPEGCDLPAPEGYDLPVPEGCKLPAPEGCDLCDWGIRSSLIHLVSAQGSWRG